MPQLQICKFIVTRGNPTSWQSFWVLIVMSIMHRPKHPRGIFRQSVALFHFLWKLVDLH